MPCEVHGVTDTCTQLSVWTTTIYNSVTINAVLCLALLLFEVTTLLAWEFITKMWKVVSFIVSEALSWLHWTESSVEYTGQCSWSWNLYTHRILINRDIKYFFKYVRCLPTFIPLKNWNVVTSSVAEYKPDTESVFPPVYAWSLSRSWILRCGTRCIRMNMTRNGKAEFK